MSRTSENELHPTLNVNADEMSGEQIYVAAYVNSAHCDLV